MNLNEVEGTGLKCNSEHSCSQWRQEQQQIRAHKWQIGELGKWKMKSDMTNNDKQPASMMWGRMSWFSYAKRQPGKWNGRMMRVEMPRSVSSFVWSFTLRSRKCFPSVSNWLMHFTYDIWHLVHHWERLISWLHYQPIYTSTSKQTYCMTKLSPWVTITTPCSSYDYDSEMKNQMRIWREQVIF